jgi:hypothetical protein
MSTYGPGESLVVSGEANYDNMHTGKLYITNSRLFFEYKTGLIRRRRIRVAETPLKDITNTFIERGPWDWNVLVIAAQSNRHKFLLRDKNPDRLMKRLAELIASLRRP